MRARDFIIKETKAATDAAAAVLSVVVDLIGEGHTEVSPDVIMTKVSAALGQPFMLKDLVAANNASPELQHYISTINPSKIKFSTDILTVKNEDPMKEKAKAQNGVASMAARAAGRPRLGEDASKPRNFVAKNAPRTGAGPHKNKKKAAKQGDLKHKRAPGSEVVEEGSVWSSADQKMKHHAKFPHTHTAAKDIHSSMSGKVIVPKGARLSALGNDNYLNLDTGAQPVKLDPASLVKKDISEATGDAKFDTMMGNIVQKSQAREIPEEELKPTEYKGMQVQSAIYPPSDDFLSPDYEPFGEIIIHKGTVNEVPWKVTHTPGELRFHTNLKRDQIMAVLNHLKANRFPPPKTFMTPKGKMSLKESSIKEDHEESIFYKYVLPALEKVLGQDSAFDRLNHRAEDAIGKYVIPALERAIGEGSKFDELNQKAEDLVGKYVIPLLRKIMGEGTEQTTSPIGDVEGLRNYLKTNGQNLHRLDYNALLNIAKLMAAGDPDALEYQLDRTDTEPRDIANYYIRQDMAEGSFGSGYGSVFTLYVNTGEKPATKTKTKKFKREDDAVLWAEDYADQHEMFPNLKMEIQDENGNVVWELEESQGVAEGFGSDMIATWQLTLDDGTTAKITTSFDEIDRDYAEKTLKLQHPKLAGKNITKIELLDYRVDTGSWSASARPFPDHRPTEPFGRPVDNPMIKGLKEEQHNPGHVKYILSKMPKGKLYKGPALYEKIMQTIIRRLGPVGSDPKRREFYQTLAADAMEAYVRQNVNETLQEENFLNQTIVIQPAENLGNAQNLRSMDTLTIQAAAQKYQIDANTIIQSLKNQERSQVKSKNGKTYVVSMPVAGTSTLQRAVSEEKDACYHKVKARYKVWPSAYASGALSKCRKVGASNWGNKTKK